MNRLLKSVIAFSTVSMLWSSGSVAQGNDAPSSGPVEMFACEFEDGKGMKDLAKVNAKFNKWADKNADGYSAWLLTPQFKAGGMDFDVLWVGAWGNGAQMGSVLDKWLSADNEELADDFNDVIDCSTGHVLVTSVAINAPDGPPKDGIVWLSACNLAEGRSGVDALEAHGKVAGALGKMGISSSSWAFFPALGLSEASFDYLQVVAHKNYSHLGANYDKYYLGGGVQKAMAIMDGVAECRSPNLFDARVVRLAKQN